MEKLKLILAKCYNEFDDASFILWALALSLLWIKRFVIWAICYAVYKSLFK